MTKTTLDFSIVPDTGKDVTLELQKAFDWCSENKATLTIVKGTYHIGTVFIKSNSTIVFEKGAVLSGIPDVAVYSENEASFVDGVNAVRGKALVLVHKAENVSICGEGLITGNGPQVEGLENNRPFLIRLVQSKQVHIKDMSFSHSISWCLHIDRCDNVTVEDVTIKNRGCPNNDGIDIDSSSFVTITGCDISSGDDGICLKSTSLTPCHHIQVSGCRVSSDCGAFKIGTESAGDFHDITVEDCEFYDVLGGGIKILPVDGGIVSDVTIKKITMNNCTGPIFIANGERNKEYVGNFRTNLSTIKNVTIESVTADVVRAPVHGFYDGEEWANAIGGIIISGIPSSRLQDITLKDLQLSLPGGYMENKPFHVREMGKMYPEFHRFDPVPAKGIYLRHADNIKIENVSMSYKEEDNREEIFLDDATVEE